MEERWTRAAIYWVRFAYNSFAARQPEEALVHFNLGEIYGRLGQFSDAAKAYHLAADLDKSEDLQVRRTLYLIWAATRRSRACTGMRWRRSRLLYS